ncbi:Coagulation factor IX [Nymphon striatum]|nr:Coagulation factor IX [Nymphon striatum]
MDMEAIMDTTLYDYVQVYDGTTSEIHIILNPYSLEDINFSILMKSLTLSDSTILGTYAGTTVPAEMISSSGTSMTVVFVSDAFVAASGFKASYTFVIKSNAHETTTAIIKTSDEPAITDNESLINELLTEVPKNEAVTIGSSFVMKCTPRLKTTTITWMKEQTIITSSNTLGLRILQDDSLSINKMNEHLEGVYTCVALGANGKTAVVRSHLFSRQPKINPGNCQISFINKPKNKTLLVGQFTFLGCFINDASMSWKQNGNPIATANSRFTILPNGHLTINNARETDTGVYTCTAVHQPTGCVRTASAFVQVIQPANVKRVCGKPILNNPETDKPRLEHGKIVNGFASKKGAHPWMAMLYTSSLGVYCGGSLINVQWIVTAAHCFTRHEIPWSSITIKLGKIDKSIREESEQVFEVEEVILHLQFDPGTFDNDIALIKLKTPATFTNFILPICLGTASFQENKFFSRGPQMGIASGWGSKWHKGPTARFLLEVVLPIKERYTCKISTRHSFTSNMFCAGFAEAGAGDTCKGDSGGPFVMSNNEQWYLIGITSWGEKCSEADKYGYYTKVSNYITWIHSIIRT